MLIEVNSLLFLNWGTINTIIIYFFIFIISISRIKVNLFRHTYIYIGNKKYITIEGDAFTDVELIHNHAYKYKF